MKKWICLLLVMGILLSLPVSVSAAGQSAPEGESSREMLLALVLGMLSFMVPFISCFVEMLISIPFHIPGSRRKLIFFTNLATQLGAVLVELLAMMALGMQTMAVLGIWIQSGVHMLCAMIELTVFRKRMEEVPANKLMLYVLCANAVTLVLTLFV